MSTDKQQTHSHRRLLKQKTNELIPYHRLAAKREKGPKANSYKSHQLQSDNHHETSIVLEKLSNNQSLISQSKNLNCKKICLAVKQEPRSSENLRGFNRRRTSLAKIRSMQSLETKPGTPKQSKCTFSVQRINRHSGSIDKFKQDPQSTQYSSVGARKMFLEPLKPKSENYLKTTLRKTSSKLKIKVKDPFEKRMKLENQFQDQSQIMKVEDSFMSTFNQEQFKEILSRIE